MPVTQLVAVNLTVADIAEMAAFYHDSLDLMVGPEQTLEGGSRRSNSRQSTPRGSHILLSVPQMISGFSISLSSAVTSQRSRRD
jgi:hypothetical protein